MNSDVVVTVWFENPGFKIKLFSFMHTHKICETQSYSSESGDYIFNPSHVNIAPVGRWKIGNDVELLKFPTVFLLHLD